MDEYVVGSVADLISDKKTLKKKSKKETLKVQSSETNQVKVKKNYKNDKSSSGAIEFTDVKNRLAVKGPSETNSENNCVKDVVEDKVVGLSKKRKKSLAAPDNEDMPKHFIPETAADNEEMPKHKKPKRDFLDLDHVPTDSEEEGENVGENLKKKKLSNQALYKEFKENTIFVGNIPIDYSKEKVCKIFSKFGPIQNARIRCVPIADINMSKKVAAIKKKFNPKRNSLVAYVKFKSQESAKSALEANGMIVNGHHLRVDMAEENQERDNKKAVFVGGLPFDIEDDELWNFFQNCGKINSVRVIRDSQTSMGKGFGYVNFDSTAAVELALQLDGLELKKRTINVKRCVKARNKNKLNAFGRKKSEEMTNQLLRKKAKKLKDDKKKLKKTKNQTSVNFQGSTANVKLKKKKKLSKAALRQRKIVKILGAS